MLIAQAASVVMNQAQELVSVMPADRGFVPKYHNIDFTKSYRLSTIKRNPLTNENTTDKGIHTYRKQAYAIVK